MAAIAVTPDTGRNLVPTVGLEIHARLSTATKLFCRCANAYGARPNSNVCPVCMGLPGTLPVLSAEAVDLALRAGLALGCDVVPRSEFARKNYFYPDLPRNYQITQYEHPLCRRGMLKIDHERIVRLERIHLEEDAGRILNAAGGEALIDLNRAGTPLIEIVTLPDLRGGDEAAACLRRLRQLLLFMGVCDGSLAQGSLRCDANVGFGLVDSGQDGTAAGVAGPWTEVKNLNSLRAVARAVDFEIERLCRRVAAGGELRRETRTWNDTSGRTEFMRPKETAADYRYFPEPDLPWLVVVPEILADQRSRLPELPLAREARYQTSLDLTEQEALTLCQRPEIAAYFEETLQALAMMTGGAPRSDPTPARLVCNWVRTQVLGNLETGAHESPDLPVTANRLAGLLFLVLRQRISSHAARRIYTRLLQDPTGPGPDDLVAALNLERIGDPDTICRWCREVIRDHPDQVAALKGGKTGLLDFLVGKTMQISAGRADPRLVRDQLLGLLERQS